MIDDVAMFKDLLRNYKKSIIALDFLYRELEENNYNQQGVKGVDFSKEPSNHVAGDRHKQIMRYTEPIDVVTNRIQALENDIIYVDYILSLMDEQDKDIVRKIYMHGLSHYELGLRLGYSESGMKKKVNNIIKSALSSQ